MTAAQISEIVQRGFADGGFRGRIVRQEGYRELTRDEAAKVEIDIDAGTARLVPLRPGDIISLPVWDDGPSQCGSEINQASVENAIVGIVQEPADPIELHLTELMDYAAKVAALNTPPKPRGGRPAKPYWGAVFGEAAHLCIVDGIPEHGAELVRHLQRCFPEEDGGPDESTLRRRISPWLAELRRRLA